MTFAFKQLSIIHHSQWAERALSCDPFSRMRNASVSQVAMALSDRPRGNLNSSQFAAFGIARPRIYGAQKGRFVVRAAQSRRGNLSFDKFAMPITRRRSRTNNRPPVKTFGRSRRGRGSCSSSHSCGRLLAPSMKGAAECKKESPLLSHSPFFTLPVTFSIRMMKSSLQAEPYLVLFQDVRELSH